MGLYTKDNVLITELVNSALSKNELIEIKNKTLDGQWHVQMIGSSATTLEVKANLSMDERIIFDDLKAQLAEVKVVFDNFWYMGVVDGSIEYIRTKFTNGPMFETTFTILVNSKGAV